MNSPTSPEVASHVSPDALTAAVQREGRHPGAVAQVWAQQTWAPDVIAEVLVMATSDMQVKAVSALLACGADPSHVAPSLAMDGVSAMLCQPRRSSMVAAYTEVMARWSTDPERVADYQDLAATMHHKAQLNWERHQAQLRSRQSPSHFKRTQLDCAQALHLHVDAWALAVALQSVQSDPHEGPSPRRPRF